jgi:hypothetical protein
MLTLTYNSHLFSNILNNLNRSKAKLFYEDEDKFRNDELYGQASVIIWYIRWAHNFVDYQVTKK